MALSPQTPPFNISIAELDNGTLWQIYCLNPPPDSCPYGPCPNPDVTGYGQQVSLYITATIFAITLVHDTQHFRYAWYGYIANVYSFLVAAVLSIARVKLTRPDAVFVILAVASPGTVYLWVLSITQLIQRRVRPTFLSRMTQIECVILFILSLGLLLFWLAMIAMLYWPTPTHHLKFSQPACLDREGDVSSSQDIFGLIWMLPFFTNWAITMLVLLLIVVWVGKPDARVEHGEVLSVPECNLFQWTFSSGAKVFDRHEYLFWKRPKFLLFPMIMLNLLSYIMYQVPIWAVLVFIVESSSFVLTLLLFLDNTVRLRLRPGRVDIFLLLLFTAFFVTSTWLYLPNTQYSRKTPSCLLIITHFIWFINFWNHRHESGILRRRVFYSLPVLFTFFGAIVFLTCFPFSEVWVPMGVDNEDVSLVITLTPVNTFGYQSSQIVWFMTWVLCSYQPSPRWWGNITRIWYGIVHSSPIFKFFILILGPTIVWIPSTHDQTPKQAVEFSFGQIYAVITSIASLMSLISALVDQRKELLAVFGLVNCGQSRGEAVPMVTAIEKSPVPLHSSSMVLTSTQVMREGLVTNSHRPNSW